MRSWAARRRKLENDEVARVLGLLGSHGHRSLLVGQVRAIQRLRRRLTVGSHDGRQRALRRSLKGLVVGAAQINDDGVSKRDEGFSRGILFSTRRRFSTREEGFP